MRKLGLSIIPKLHGMEEHAVKQMRKMHGGIIPLMEHWIKHFHQTGSNFDMTHRHQKSTTELEKLGSEADLLSMQKKEVT